ncbi:MAG: DsbC family protein [Pseudomonadota bacterium]
MKNLLAIMLFSLLSSAHAGEKEIRLSMQEKFPGIEIGHVIKTPYSGLYEIIIDGQLLYTDSKGDYLFDGHIIETGSRRDLSEERSKKLFAVDFDKLPLALAIKTVKGNGKRKLAQFTDPNCGFCKKLEKELSQVDNVTIYSFLYPIFNGSDEIVRDVLCSKNPTKAWDDWMLRGIKPVTANCATETDKVKALGRKMRVTGTPNLIFADGIQNPGYMPADALEKRLDEASRK